MRASGILLPISSLPSKYGIGAFSKSAYNFIDILVEMKQKYWQILPIGTTGFGDSPYQSFSTFAGNPYFIDLDEFVESGIITEKEIEKFDFGNNSRYVDYEKLYLNRYEILKIVFKKVNLENDLEFLEFKKQNSFWLEDFTLFMAIKNHYNGLSWTQWDSDIKKHNPQIISKLKLDLHEEISFHEFIQFVFSRQFKKLKDYANKNNVKIIGDIPIYVSEDSSDCWANPELFLLDADMNPSFVSGCPPDGFSESGQLWGNPLYDWDYHKKTNYDWWISRIKYCLEIHDVVRIDHFRGFDEYYIIPSQNETAENGTWNKGPGIDLFNEIEKQLGKVNIIAEDLGFVTESVEDLLKQTGFPGMKIIQFAFDSREKSDYLTHNYVRNSVVYTGTHDNPTIIDWYSSISEADREFSKRYLNNYNTPDDEINWDFIRHGMQSVSKLCVIPIQDYLGLGAEARMNTPSTMGNNWKWRLLEKDITKDLIKKIATMTETYGR